MGGGVELEGKVEAAMTTSELMVKIDEMYRVPVVFFPAQEGKPAEPAPYLMTPKQVCRFIGKGEVTDPHKSVWRLHEKGLMPVRTGRSGASMYRLSNVLEVIDRLAADKTR